MDLRVVEEAELIGAEAIEIYLAETDQIVAQYYLSEEERFDKLSVNSTNTMQSHR